MTGHISTEDAIKLAQGFVNIAFKITSFFFLFSFAIAGWIIINDVITDTDSFSYQRLYWASLYTFVSAVLIIGVVQSYRRVNACYALARINALDKDKSLIDVAAKHFNQNLTVGAIICSVIFADVAILLFEIDD